MSQILTAVGAALEAAQICPPKVLLDAIRTSCKGTGQPDVIWAANIVVGAAEGPMLAAEKKKPHLALVSSIKTHAADAPK